MYDDAYTRDNEGKLAVRTVVVNEGSSSTSYDDVFTRDEQGKLCLRTTGNGGGGSVDYNRVIEKSATIPAATSANAGKVYMYTGQTNSTYTHGYIYENQSTTVYDSTVEFNPASLSGTTVTCSGSDFASFVEEWGSGNITDIIKGTLTYDESGGLLVFVGLDDTDTQVCTFQLYTQDYEDAGFTITGTLEDGDVIAFDTTITESTTYSWVRIDVQPAGGSGAVSSVNGQTGDVVLNAEDVGALPSDTHIPNDQVQSNWNEDDTEDPSYIQNKPTIPTTAGQVGAVPQYSTMPTAGSGNVGQVVQYSGTSTNTYTNGYFYKNEVSYTDPSATVTQTVGSGLSDLAIDVDTFVQAEQPTQDETVDFVASVTPAYYEPSSSFNPGFTTSINVSVYKSICESNNWDYDFLLIMNPDPDFTDGEWQIGKAYDTIYAQSLTLNDLESTYGITITNVPSVSDNNNEAFFSYQSESIVWEKGEAQVNISEYGITFSGTPSDGDTLEVDYTAPVASGYNWERIDVQPAGGSGGGDAIEWKTKVDLPAEYYGDEYHASPYYTVSGGLPDGTYEVYFSSKTTTDSSTYPAGEIILKVKFIVDNTEQTMYGKMGYVFNGSYMNDGNTIFDTLSFWSFGFKNNSDFILYSSELPWASAILGYNGHSAVPECFKLSAIKNIDTGDEYTAVGAINLDGTAPAYTSSYTSGITLTRIVPTVEMPHYNSIASNAFNDNDNYLFVGSSISYSGFTSTCSEMDISLVSSNGGKYHVIIENSYNSYDARVLEASGDLENAQLGLSGSNAYIYLNTPSGTSGTIYSVLGSKGAYEGVYPYIASQPESFTPVVITEVGSTITVDILGKILQYTKNTSASYTNGYFYKATGTIVVVPASCVANNISPNDFSITIDTSNIVSSLATLIGWSQQDVKQSLNNSGYQWRIFYDTDTGTISSIFWPVYGEITDSSVLSCFTISTTGEYTGVQEITFYTQYTEESSTIQNPAWVRVDTQPLDLTGVTGYDATKTQVLKNVLGVLTWVDEA